MPRSGKLTEETGRSRASSPCKAATPLMICCDGSVSCTRHLFGAESTLTSGAVQEVDNRIHFGIADLCQVDEARWIMGEIGVPEGAVVFRKGHYGFFPDEGLQAKLRSLAGRVERLIVSIKIDRSPPIIHWPGPAGVHQIGRASLRNFRPTKAGYRFGPIPSRRYCGAQRGLRSRWSNSNQCTVPASTSSCAARSFCLLAITGTAASPVNRVRKAAFLTARSVSRRSAV